MDQHQDEREIRLLDEAWSRALEKKDLEAAMSNYAEDAVFLAPGAPIIQGKGRIRDRFAERMVLPGYSASFVPTRIVVAGSRDMAYELGTYRASFEGEGGRVREVVGKHLLVWEKRAGRWQVTAESISPDQP
jgi:uncharacterized protein (TIGR02246 family)